MVRLIPLKFDVSWWSVYIFAIWLMNIGFFTFLSYCFNISSFTQPSPKTFSCILMAQKLFVCDHGRADELRWQFSCLHRRFFFCSSRPFPIFSYYTFGSNAKYELMDFKDSFREMNLRQSFILSSSHFPIFLHLTFWWQHKVLKYAC